MSGREPMTQTAPYPQVLADLVKRVKYKADEGWKIWLEDDMERDPGSRGMTLIIQRCGPDTYHPEHHIRVNHPFAVPPATYNERSWRWWLFNDCIRNVEDHERMENFQVRCPTPCDDDCEVGPRGCHEVHDVPSHRSHDPEECNRGRRPYAPAHAPGNSPYLVLEHGTDTDRRTSFRGVLDDDGTGRSR
jgi:hypothetical protein